MTADRRENWSDGPEDDPLLDACLDEVLGGRAPPDLTARIAAALEARTGAPGEAVPPPVAREGANRPVPVAAPRRGRRRSWIASWPGAVVAACLLVALTVGGAVALRRQGESDVVKAPPESPNERYADPRPSPAPANEPTIAQDERAPEDAEPSAKEDDPATSQLAESPTGGFEATPPFAADRRDPEAAPPSEPAYATRPKPDYDADVVAYINRNLQQAWEQQGVSPSPPATDGEWARRAYLRLIGRTPSYEELAAYVESPSSNKKEELVNQLLFEDEYVEQYARHWSGVWTNLLIGRTGGTGENDLAVREGLEQYLRRSFQFNKPYDQMAFELVSATGANRPGTEGYNGAVNFLLANYTHDYTLVTSKTARVFLGKQLHCAQCHNHPFESWTQDDYWRLNAFFRQTHTIRDADKVRLANRDFAGETGDTLQADIFYDRLSGLRKVAYPTWLDGTKINPHGQVARVDRRRELANFLADSPDLSRAMVNRLWSHFLGYGFVEPVDDMRPTNPPSHPELLEYLADQFVAHNYDVKRLMRWIVLQDAFGVSSRIAPQNMADAPEQGTAPLFSRYYTRQMEAEEVYETLSLLASNFRRDSDLYAELKQEKRGWLAQFTQDLETDEGDEANTFNGAIPQSLAMMNGELIHRALTSEQGFLHRLARSELKPAEKLNRLFLATLARRPTRREVEAANQLLVAHQGDTAAALQDLCWALLNSNEFILDH